MTQDNLYFFIDGSCLLGDISKISKSSTYKEIADKKFCVTKFYKHFSGSKYYQFLGDGYRRFTIFFVIGEKRVATYLNVPDFRQPNVVEDFSLKYCGKKLTGSKKVDDWLQKAKPPKYVMERFNKSEKAVDTQICCDALQLAANDKLDRLFLYTNDYDFMPLINVLKSLGINISLFRLISMSVNTDLVNNCDSFCVPDRNELANMFV